MCKLRDSMVMVAISAVLAVGAGSALGRGGFGGGGGGRVAAGWAAAEMEWAEEARETVATVPMAVDQRHRVP